MRACVPDRDSTPGRAGCQQSGRASDDWTDQMSTTETTPPTQVRAKASPGKDLLLVLILTIGVFVFGARVELNERILALTQPLEPYQIDELPITVLVLVLGMGWFSWRRWREFSREFELRQAAQQALAETLSENRLLSQKNVLAQEEERRVLARELHDELGQSLNAIKLDAVAIRDRVPEETDEVRQNAEAIIDVANHVHETVRNLTRQLRPVALDELGLRDALELYVTQWARRNTPVVCTFDTAGEVASLGELLNITVYRCVQECLTNITRHAAASRVRVALTRTPGQIELLVEDDGRGMDLAAKRAGVGLIGLRERAESLRGEVQLTSTRGTGLRVQVRLPVEGTVH